MIPTIRKHTQKIQCASTACQQVDPTQRLSQVSWLSASSPPPDAPPTTTPCDGWLRFWPSSLQASIPASTGSGTPHSTSPLPEMVHGLTATSRGGGHAPGLPPIAWDTYLLSALHDLPTPQIQWTGHTETALQRRHTKANGLLRVVHGSLAPTASYPSDPVDWMHGGGCLADGGTQKCESWLNRGLTIGASLTHGALELPAWLAPATGAGLTSDVYV